MADSFIGADNTITSLGFSTATLVENIKADRTGISLYPGGNLFPTPAPLSLIDFKTKEHLFQASLGKTSAVLKPDLFTRLERLHILSISEVLKSSQVDIRDPRTPIVLSTTKGNSDLLSF